MAHPSQLADNNAKRKKIFAPGGMNVKSLRNISQTILTKAILLTLICQKNKGQAIKFAELKLFFWVEEKNCMYCMLTKS